MTVGARSAAILGAVLALPFALLYLLLVLHIEPPLGALESLKVAPDQPNVIGSAIVLGAWLLSVAAFIATLSPIVRDVRAGRPLVTHPVNLALASVILLFVVAFVVSLVVDQYPCWIGVPNCD
jgi:uncharacterized membrane protein YidH (DUF202 family)